MKAQMGTSAKEGQGHQGKGQGETFEEVQGASGEVQGMRPRIRPSPWFTNIPESSGYVLPYIVLI